MSNPPSQRKASPTLVLAGLLAVYLFSIGIIVVVVAAVRSEPAASAAATTVDVSLTEFAITGQLSAPAGAVKINVTNDGTVAHNLGVKNGAITPDIQPGESAVLDLGDVPEGDIELYCAVPGHSDAGMKATLAITAAGDTSSGADMAGMDHGSSSSSGSTPDYAQMDKDMLASFSKFPAATEGVGNPVLEPTVLPDGTKQFELTAKVAKWEVEPGRVVDAWTYNGVVPAPMIKLNVGDKIRGPLPQRAPGHPGHPLARDRDALRHGRRRSDHPGAGLAQR